MADTVIRCVQGRSQPILRCADQSPAMGCIAPGLCAEHVPNAPAPALNLGNAAGPLFHAVPLDVEGEPDSVLVLFKDRNQPLLSAVRLDPTTGTVTDLSEGLHALGAIPSSQFAVAVGGPSSRRRIYVAYSVVGSTGVFLEVAVFDPSGRVISGPRRLGATIQVVRPTVAGHESGAAVSHAVMEADMSWDPTLIVLDLEGNTVTEHTVEDAPGQINSAYVATTDSGTLVTGHVRRTPGFRGRTPRLTRFRNGRAMDATPIEVAPRDSFAGDFSFMSMKDAALESIWLSIPTNSPGTTFDHRLARFDTETGVLSDGVLLSSIVPSYPGTQRSLHSLLGSEGLVAWEIVELWAGCPCSAPPPLSVAFMGQLMDVRDDSPIAIGIPFIIHAWQTADPAAALDTPGRDHPAEPRIVASTRHPGRFTAVWSSANGRLAFRTFSY